MDAHLVLCGDYHFVFESGTGKYGCFGENGKSPYWFRKKSMGIMAKIKKSPHFSKKIGMDVKAISYNHP